MHLIHRWNYIDGTKSDTFCGDLRIAIDADLTDFT